MGRRRRHRPAQDSAKGAASRVHSNIVEQVNGGAGRAGAASPRRSATAFARFAKDSSSRHRQLSQARQPEAALQYWLRNLLKADPASLTTGLPGRGADPAMPLTGAIDGAAILEPTVTTVLTRLPQSRVAARGSQLFPNQLGAVLLVRDKLIMNILEAVQQPARRRGRYRLLVRRPAHRRRHAGRNTPAAAASTARWWCAAIRNRDDLQPGGRPTTLSSTPSPNCRTSSPGYQPRHRSRGQPNCRRLLAVRHPLLRQGRTAI